jgi:hypothetical protein
MIWADKFKAGNEYWENYYQKFELDFIIRSNRVHYSLVYWLNTDLKRFDC